MNPLCRKSLLLEIDSIITALPIQATMFEVTSAFTLEKQLSFCYAAQPLS